MEFECDDKDSTTADNNSCKKQELFCIKTSSSWEIDNGKILEDCISTASILQVPEK